MRSRARSAAVLIACLVAAIVLAAPARAATAVASSSAASIAGQERIVRATGGLGQPTPTTCANGYIAHFVITQIFDPSGERTPESLAPQEIVVEWSDRATERVHLTKVSGRTAHYLSTGLHFDGANVVRASTFIYKEWSSGRVGSGDTAVNYGNGQFDLGDYECSLLPPCSSLSLTVSVTGMGRTPTSYASYFGQRTVTAYYSDGGTLTGAFKLSGPVDLDGDPATLGDLSFSGTGIIPAPHAVLKWGFQIQLGPGGTQLAPGDPSLLFDGGLSIDPIAINAGTGCATSDSVRFPGGEGASFDF